MKLALIALTLFASHAFARLDTDIDVSKAKMKTERVEIVGLTCRFDRSDKAVSEIEVKTQPRKIFGIETSSSSTRLVQFDTCYQLMGKVTAAIYCHGSAKVTHDYNALDGDTLIGFDESTIDYGKGACL